MSASTSMKPQRQPYQQDPPLDIEEMDDDFLFTHIPSTSLDFEDILNLAEPHSQTLPSALGHAQVDGKDSATQFNLHSIRNPDLHPYHTPVLDASTPSMTWSTSQSASSPESTFSLGNGGGTGNGGSGFAVEGLGNVSSPSSLMQQQQQQQQQVFLRQQQQLQHQQQLLFQQYQQQQSQLRQPQFQQLHQQQHQSQGQGQDQGQAPSFNPDPFSLDGFGFDFSYEEPKYQSGNGNNHHHIGNTNFNSGTAFGSGMNTGLNPAMNTGLVFDLNNLTHPAFPGSDQSQWHLYGQGQGQGQQGQQGRARRSFEGTLGFGMGGPEIAHNPNSNPNLNFDLDSNSNSNLNVNLDLGLALDSAGFVDENSSGEVLSEQELKRLLSMGGGGGNTIGNVDGNGSGDEFGFGAGFGGTVDWVGLLQGGGAGMLLQPDQAQAQPRERGEDGLAGGVKRESIDETESTTSTAKGTASIVEAGELAPSTTINTDAAANAGPPAAPTSNPNRSPRQQQSKQPGINLHNKVEKRYRSNVKNALDSLRDSVPRLRQVYGTSLPSEIETTDKPDEGGLVGGVSEIGKPTKQTVMLGARMYIEYLEMKDHAGEAKRERSDRVLMRLLGTGPDSGDKWAKWEREQERVGKLAEEAYRQALERKSVERALMLAPPGGSTSGGSPSSSSPPDGADEEEEEEAPPVRGRPKKRPRENEDDAEDKKPTKKRSATAKQPKKAGGKKATPSVETVTGAGAAVMYSFGLAYTFFPRASSVFQSSARQGQVAEGSRSTGSVILSAPYRAANQSTHLLKRALPERHHDFWVLRPDDFLDWVGLFFLAGVLSWITWRLIRSFGLLTADTSNEAEDEQAVEGQQVEVDVLTESGYRGRIGTIVEGLKSLGSKFGRRHGDDEPAVERAWLRLTKAFVGKSLDLDAWTQTRVRWRMARKAGENPHYAVLQALHTQDALHWQRARKLALDSGDKAIHDVVALPCSETRALSKRLGPSEDPVRSIAEYLVVTHLDDLATRLYISLVDASISSDIAIKNRLASLADVSYKEQIFEALHGVSKDSPAYSLGLVLIGLWGMLSGQDAGAQRSVANMLIASQLKDRADLPSIDVFLRLVVPAYRSIKGDVRSGAKPNRLSLGVEELDTLLEVCLRYVSLVKKLNSRDLATRRGVYPETLLIRQLLGRPTFERTFKDISGYRMRASSSSDGSGSDTESLAGSEEGSISAIEAEVEAFDIQTDKLIDTLVEIGQRAASAINA